MPKKAPRDIIRTVGRRIAELRQARMTQAEFAETLGTSVQWVSRLEVGENLTLTTLDRVARALEVPVALLLAEPDRRAREITKGRPRKKTST